MVSGFWRNTISRYRLMRTSKVRTKQLLESHGLAVRSYSERHRPTMHSPRSSLTRVAYSEPYDPKK